MTKKRITHEVAYYLNQPSYACDYLQYAYDYSLAQNPNNDEINKDFLHSLGDLLFARGQTVEQLSRNCGIARSHLYRVFNKNGNITLSNLRKLLLEAGITIQFVPLKIDPESE